MSDYDLTDKERLYRKAAWDKFSNSKKHARWLAPTAVRAVAKAAFYAAFEAGLFFAGEVKDD